MSTFATLKAQDWAACADKACAFSSLEHWHVPRPKARVHTNWRTNPYWKEEATKAFIEPMPLVNPDVYIKELQKINRLDWERMK